MLNNTDISGSYYTLYNDEVFPGAYGLYNGAMRKKCFHVQVEQFRWEPIIGVEGVPASLLDCSLKQLGELIGGGSRNCRSNAAAL